jgi:hypothetical protein
MMQGEGFKKGNDGNIMIH